MGPTAPVQQKRCGRGLWTVCYHINRWTDAGVPSRRGPCAPALTDIVTVCDGYPPRRATALDWSTPPSAAEARGMYEVIDGSLSR